MQLSNKLYLDSKTHNLPGADVVPVGVVVVSATTSAHIKHTITVIELFLYKGIMPNKIMGTFRFVSFFRK